MLAFPWHREKQTEKLDGINISSYPLLKAGNSIEEIEQLKNNQNSIDQMEFDELLTKIVDKGEVTNENIDIIFKHLHRRVDFFHSHG